MQQELEQKNWRMFTVRFFVVVNFFLHPRHRISSNTLLAFLHILLYCSFFGWCMYLYIFIFIYKYVYNGCDIIFHG